MPTLMFSCDLPVCSCGVYGARRSCENGCIRLIVHPKMTCVQTSAVPYVVLRHNVEDVLSPILEHRPRILFGSVGALLPLRGISPEDDITVNGLYIGPGNTP